MSDRRWRSCSDTLPPEGVPVELSYENPRLFGYRVGWRIAGHSWDSNYVAPGGAIRAVKILEPVAWRHLGGPS